MRMPEDHAVALAQVIILERSLMRLGEPGGLQRPEIVSPVVPAVQPGPRTPFRP